MSEKIGARADRFQRRTGITARDREILTHLPLFVNLAPDMLGGLLADAWVQSFARYTVLFMQDEPASRFYVILDGWVRVYRITEEGGESVINVFTRGDSFAECAICPDAVYPVNASVIEDSRLLVIPAKSFAQQLSEHSEYALNIVAAMSCHLHLLVRQVEQLMLRSSTERVADFLVKLCPDNVPAATIQLPLEKAMIAGRLGMQPETLSRSLTKLRRLGVESKGREVCIPDVKALWQLSRGGENR
jgi:CRP-like cAMP-binding protein